jgi:hypothetical protein
MLLTASVVLNLPGTAHAAAGPVITSGPASPGSATSVTWTFTLPPQRQAVCLLTYQNQVVDGPNSCAGSATFDLGGRPFGTYTFTVGIGFGAGQSASSTYVFQAANPPAAPTITSAPASPGTATAVSWGFALPAGTTARCTLLFAGSTVSGPSACTSPKGYTLSSGDGTYTFRVEAVDSQGAVSTPATRTYTLDTTPPPTPVITGSPSSPNDAHPTWTFTATGTTSTCTLRSGGVAVYGPASCSGSVTYDLTTKPAATYVFSVTTADGLGNTSPAATSTYTYNGIPAPPAPTITSSPVSPGRNPAPTWTFTTAAGTTTACSILQGTSVVVSPTACAGSFSPSLGPLGDGAYTFRVTATDSSTGLTSTPATRTYTLDTTPPAAPVFTATPPALSSDSTPVWQFTTPAGATSLTCTLKQGLRVVGAPSPCSGSFGPDLRSQPDGSYTVTVTATDAAGNTSAPAASTATIDRTPPAAPTITSAPASPNNTAAPTWTFTTPTDPSGVTDQCTLSFGGSVAFGPAPCSGAAAYDLTGNPDGTYTFAVLAVDGAGNASPAATSSMVRNTQPPASPTILTGPGSRTSASSVNWTFRAPASTTTQCILSRGINVVFGPVSCGSPAAFDLSGLPAGTYTFSVIATDTAGNTSAPSAYSFAWQPPPPPPPSPSPSPSSPPPPSSPGGSDSGSGSGGSGPGGSPFGPLPTPGAAAGPSAGPVLVPTGPGLLVLPTPTTATPKRGSGAAGARPQGSSGGPAGAPGSPDATVATPTTAPEAPVEQIIRTAGVVAGAVSKKAAFPALLLLCVVLFLLVQDQIDRRDPKLAQAPVHPTNDLGFDPPPTRRAPR